LSKTTKILICPDVHAPYHDRRAFGCFLRVAAGWRPDGCVVLGDFADFCEVSSHPKDPKRRIPFSREVAGVNEALDQLDAALGRNCWGEFLQGNHETRLERFVADKAPVLDGVVKPWDELLRLAERGWNITPYKESLEIGELRLTHDVGRAGVNSARASLLDTGANIAFGHTHRLIAHYQGQLGGGAHVGITCGWLGDPMAIDYRHRDSVRRDSIHGFATVHMLANGKFWITPVPIIAGQAVVDGVVY
jgi:hypothetical protein